MERRQKIVELYKQGLVYKDIALSFTPEVTKQDIEQILKRMHAKKKNTGSILAVSKRLGISYGLLRNALEQGKISGHLRSERAKTWQITDSDKKIIKALKVKCFECRKLFLPKGSRKKYCSNKCYQAYLRKRSLYSWLGFYDNARWVKELQKAKITPRIWIERAEAKEVSGLNECAMRYVIAHNLLPHLNTKHHNSYSLEHCLEIARLRELFPNHNHQKTTHQP